MKFFIYGVTTLLALVNYAIAGRCVKLETESCLKAMNQILGDGQPDAMCRASKGLKDCNLRTIERCALAPGVRKLQSTMDKLDEQIENACSPDKTAVDSDFTDDEKKIAACMADETKIASHVSKCSAQMITEVKESSHTHQDDLKCKMMISSSRCMAQEIANGCDKSLEEMLYHKILVETMRKDRIRPYNPICFDAMKEAVVYFNTNSRQRRSLSGLSFAKFLP